MSEALAAGIPVIGARNYGALGERIRAVAARTGCGLRRNGRSTRWIPNETVGASASPARVDRTARRRSVDGARRAAAGSQWIEQLQLSGSVSDPFLVHNAKRGNFLVEGKLRRQIKAGMLYSALEAVLGAGRDIGAGELDRWNEGPPVEVLEGPSGPAFVVVAGRRLTLRGLPLPNPVTTEEMLRFPEGQEIRVGGGASGSGGARSRVARVRALVRRDGVAATGTKVLKRGTRKVVRKLRAAAK
jgi:hypothetical protein